ncbi:MAG: hypothetical protein IJ833_05205 [Lachnospiraceae bacterium]|nr:hypothetical protein [Lachnospiraceae bacterium]
MDIGMNSILAEYHRELLERYNLFAIDSSYGTVNAGSANVMTHLKGYMNRNFSNQNLFLGNYLYRDFLGLSVQDATITQELLLTDGKGEVFRALAAEAARDDVGLNGLAELMEWLKVVENNELLTRDIRAEKQAVDKQIQEIAVVPVDNPTILIENKRKEGILKHVIADPQSLSRKHLREENLFTARMERGQVNLGNMEALSMQGMGDLEEKFFFLQYLLSYMGTYRTPKEQGALSYQIEYLLEGKDSDVENLRHVANTLCGLREVANTMYLYSDSTKCAEVELIATAISSLLTVPEIEPLLETTLILGWAYMESLYDVKTLLAGGRIPLMKDASSWHYGLEGALETNAPAQKLVSSEQGLSYEDYLRIFLMLQRDEELTQRAMSMVEADVRMSPGNQAFRLDACVVELEACVRIKSKYGYWLDITRKKSY